MFQEIDKILDSLLDGHTLGKLADVYELMLINLESRGFSREEAIQILVNFKINN
jgi:hypothetical protein